MKLLPGSSYKSLLLLSDRVIRGPKYCHRFPTPSTVPQGVISGLNKQKSVPGDTKCQRVQSLLVISATIALVTSYAGRWPSFFPVPAVPSSQQLDAISPALLPPSNKEGQDFGCPLRNCLYSLDCLEKVFSEIRTAPVLCRTYWTVSSLTSTQYESDATF